MASLSIGAQSAQRLGLRVAGVVFALGACVFPVRVRFVCALLSRVLLPLSSLSVHPSVTVLFVSLCFPLLRGARGFVASLVLVVISRYDGHGCFSEGSR